MRLSLARMGQDMGRSQDVGRQGMAPEVVEIPFETRLRRSTAPYQMAVRTVSRADEVLDQLDVRQVVGMAIAERGPHYLLLKPAKRFRYGADLAAALAIAIVLALLICSAITPLVLAGLPAAFLPALPLLLEHRPEMAISAIEDDDGATRVTAHGQATEELAAFLDRYLGGLPPANDTAPSDALSAGAESL